MYRLLIVEDEEFLRKSLCVMIDWQGLGIQVAGAVENGGEALRFLQEQGMERPVDIVLTDIRMPVMDGLELAGELQSRYPGIKTVLYSAYSEFSFAQKGIEYGVSGYLLKSQDEEEIENYFREMCHRMQKEAAPPLPAMAFGKRGSPSPTGCWPEFPPKRQKPPYGRALCASWTSAAALRL